MERAEFVPPRFVVGNDAPDMFFGTTPKYEDEAAAPRIFCRRWLEVPSPLGALFIVHGAGEHSGRYDELARYMNREARLLVYSLDHRGCGRSDGQRNHVEDLSLLVDDWQRYVTMVQRDFPRDENWSTFILGHSMGGLITAALVLRNALHFDGVILSAPALLPGPDVSGAVVPAARLLGAMAPNMRFKAVEPRYIVSDAAGQEAYARDKLICYEPVTALLAWNLLQNGSAVLQRTHEWTLPTLVIKGSDDVLVSGAKEFFQNIASIDKAYEEFEGSCHEVHQDKDKERMFDLTRNWMTFRLRTKSQNKAPVVATAPYN